MSQDLNQPETKVFEGAIGGLETRMVKAKESQEQYEKIFEDVKSRYIAEGRDIEDPEVQSEMSKEAGDIFAPNPLPDTPALDKRYVIIFHNDADGWGACGLALNGLTDPTRTFLTKPVNYSDDFSTLLENLNPTDHVYVLDFSFKRELCDAIYAKVEKLVVLDHHKTAEKELEGATYATFDMTKSGVLLAYEHFFADYLGGKDVNGDGFEMVPIPVRLLDNYDLWKKSDPKVSWDYVVGFHLYVKDYFGDYGFWRELMAMDDLNPGLWGIIAQKFQWFKDAISELKASANYSKEEHNGRKFIVYPCSSHISLIADAFRDEKELDLDFTVSYFIKEDEVVVSLRGSKMGVRGIAEANGGGGHDKASGFFFKFKEEDDINSILVAKIKNSIEPS